MENTYRVIDLCMLYRDLEPDIAYLGFRAGMSEEFIGRKIRIAPKRYLNVKYDKNNKIHLILKKENLGEYNIFEVPEKNESIDFYGYIMEKGIKVSNLEYDYWVDIKKNLRYEMDYMYISDSAVLLEGYDGSFIMTIIPKSANFSDVDYSLKKLRCSYSEAVDDIELFNKCIQGEQISTADLHMLFKTPYEELYMDLGTLKFFVNHGMITVCKKFNKLVDKGEEMVFRFNEYRVGDIPIFIDYVLSAESEKELVERINKYFIF